MEVEQRDVTTVSRLFAELVAFFSTPKNDRTAEGLDRWLAAGMYKRLHAAYYNIGHKWFPVQLDGELGAPSQAPTTAPKLNVERQQVWAVYQLLEDLVGFLHQPLNFRSSTDVGQWLRAGVLNRLRAAYHEIETQWIRTPTNG